MKNYEPYSWRVTDLLAAVLFVGFPLALLTALLVLLARAIQEAGAL